MADKANKYDIQAKQVTYIAGAGIAYDATQPNGSAHVGKLVMLSAEDTVDLVTTGSEIFGKLIKVEKDGFCAVQERGYADIPTDGSAITYTNTNNGAVGGATAGTAKVAIAVPAVGAFRHTIFIKSDGTNKAIVKFI